jgi:hypothetical protein
VVRIGLELGDQYVNMRVKTVPAHLGHWTLVGVSGPPFRSS